MNDGKVVAFGGPTVSVCLPCALEVQGHGTHDPRVVIHKAGDPCKNSIEIERTDVDTLNNWLAVMHALGHRASTQQRAQAEAFAVNAVADRVVVMQMALLKRGLPPCEDLRVLTELVRLSCDVEDAVLTTIEEQQRPRKKR